MAPISQWTIQQVSLWLESESLGHLAAPFAKNGVDGRALINLTKQDLKDELDISKLSDRKLLWAALEKLFAAHGLTPASGSPTAATTATTTVSPRPVSPRSGSLSSGTTSTTITSTITTSTTPRSQALAAASSSSRSGSTSSASGILPPLTPTGHHHAVVTTTPTAVAPIMIHSTTTSTTSSSTSSSNAPIVVSPGRVPATRPIALARGRTASGNLIDDAVIINQVKKETEALYDLMQELEGIKVNEIKYSPVSSAPEEHPILPPPAVPGNVPGYRPSGAVISPRAASLGLEVDRLKGVPEKINYQRLIEEQQRDEQKMAVLKERHDEVMRLAGFR